MSSGDLIEMVAITFGLRKLKVVSGQGQRRLKIMKNETVELVQAVSLILETLFIFLPFGYFPGGNYVSIEQVHFVRFTSGFEPDPWSVFVMKSKFKALDIVIAGSLNTLLKFLGMFRR
jgi:hypothetical protein